MKLTGKTIVCLIICALLFLGSIGLTAWEFASAPDQAEQQQTIAAQPPSPITIEIAAVGDNLMHMPVINSCKTDEGYNFDPIYENVKKYLEGMDIKAINQETVFINDPSRYSGYPSFGGPSAVGDSLVKAGFNVIEQASNHSYDKGTDGLSDTIAYWKTKDVILLGVNEDPQSALRVDTFVKDGFSVAMLNYTYSLNGYVLPAGKEYLVNILSEEAKEQLAQQIALAKSQSDIVVMFPHWGTEYSTVPDEYQLEWLSFFNENGVDIIIGAHPHVVQSVEEYIGESGYKTLVFYSLGNFVSNQDTIVKELGAMARVTLVKDENGARIEGYSLEPLFTHVSGGKYSVYMLSDYTDELAASHSKYGGSLRVDMIWNKYNDIVSK